MILKLLSNINYYFKVSMWVRTWSSSATLMKMWNVCFVPSCCVHLWWDLLKGSTLRPVRHEPWQKKSGPPNIDKVLRHIFTGSDLTKPWRTVKKLKIAWAYIPVSLLRHSRHMAVLTEEKRYAVLSLLKWKLVPVVKATKHLSSIVDIFVQPLYFSQQVI